MGTRGWGVKELETGRIMPETVAETQRTAKVNWLVTHGKVFVTNAWTDTAILAAFYRLKQGAGVEAVEVEITEAGNGQT